MRSRAAAVLSLSASLLLLGCPMRVGSQPELDPDSREKLAQARLQAERGGADEAMRLLGELPHQESPDVADVLFAVAESRLRAKDFAGARAGYRDLLARFPLFARADLAKHHLGLAQLELGAPKDALQTLAPLWPRLQESDRPEAAAALARASEGARAWGEAARWNLELADRARDEATQRAAARRVLDLVESRLSFLDVSRLAQEVAPSSPSWPMIQFKLARIFAHLRDGPRAKEALETLLAKAPQSPWAAEARTMLARAERRASSRTDTLGLALPLSGKFRAFGESVLAGVKLALEGSTVKLVVRDTAGDPAQARKAVGELILDEQVIAVIGPILSAEAADAAAEAELQETPIITLTRAEGITDLGPHVFRNMLTNSAQAQALVDYAMRVRGLKRFALLFPNIPYGTELTHFFWDEVEARNGEIVGAEGYDADQTTFGPTVKKLVGRHYLDQREEFVSRRREILDTVKDPFRQRKLMEEARKKLPPVIDFDAIFLPDYFKNVGLVAPALAVEDVITNVCDRRDLERIAKTAGKDLKQLKPVQLFGANGWNFEELVERGGKFVQCAIFVDGFFARSDRKETRAFVEAFRKAHGRDPALLEAEGYDSAAIARNILEQVRPTNRAAMREALLKVKDFPGATGRTTINERGEAEAPLFLLTIDRGEIREIDSETAS